MASRCLFLLIAKFWLWNQLGGTLSTAQESYFRITRHPNGDILESNVLLECGKYKAECIPHSNRIGNKCAKCRCVSPRTFMEKDRQKDQAFPGGMCTKVTDCNDFLGPGSGKGSGYFPAFLQSSLTNNENLGLVSITRQEVDRVVGRNLTRTRQKCTSKPIRVSFYDGKIAKWNETKELTFVVVSTGSGGFWKNNMYKIDLKWNILLEERKDFKGRVMRVQFECQKQACLFLKVEGDVTYYGPPLPTIPVKTDGPTTSPQGRSTKSASETTRFQSVTTPSTTEEQTTTTVTTNVPSTDKTTLASKGMSTTIATVKTTTRTTKKTTEVSTTELSTTELSTTELSTTELSTAKRTTKLSTKITTEISTSSKTTSTRSMTQIISSTHGSSSVSWPWSKYTRVTETVKTTVAGVYPPVKSSDKKSKKKLWPIIVGVCLVLLLLVIAVSIVVWIYWKRKRRYCYDGAPIFTRLERSSVDSQKPDIVPNDYNLSYGDLKLARDNIGVDGSKSDLMQPEYARPEPQYEDYEVTPSVNFSQGNSRPALNNNRTNEYEPARGFQNIELKNRSQPSGAGLPTQYQPLSDRSNAVSNVYEGLTPGGEPQYAPLGDKPQKEEYYTGLVKNNIGDVARAGPMYSVLEYEDAGSNSRPYIDHEYAEYGRT